MNNCFYWVKDYDPNNSPKYIKLNPTGRWKIVYGPQYRIRYSDANLPILYIDEDDVKASHALSVGQPDAEQLYYLNSRGLTMRQAIGLLSVGYFKPILELIEDEELKEKIAQETEERVGMYEY